MGARQHRSGSAGLQWQRAQVDAQASAAPVDRSQLVPGILLAADAVVIVAAALAALALPVARPATGGAMTVAAAVLMTAWLAHRRTVEHEIASAPDGIRGPAGLRRLFCCWGVTMGLVGLSAWLARDRAGAPGWLLGWWGIAAAGFVVVRLVLAHRLRVWRRRGLLAHIVAIVDLDGSGRLLARRLRGQTAQAVRLLGNFHVSQADPDQPPAATIDDLIALSRRFRVDDVLVTMPAPGQPLPDVLRRLLVIPTTISLCLLLPGGPAPGLADDLATSSSAGGRLFGIPTLVLRRPPLAGWQIVAKRGADLLIGGVALALIWPVMLLIAVAVKLDTAGPVMFRQRRMGFNNNPIMVCKFRSMTHLQADGADVRQASRQDPRVTRMGRLLRRTSLDELPQIFNVLRGEMSLVGPRPHAIAHDSYYAPLIADYHARHRVRPGITGWAQVNGLRGETDTLDKMRRRVEHDLVYIDRWSVLLDLRIMAQTVLGVLFHREAF